MRAYRLDFLRAGDLDARGGCLQRDQGVVEDPEAGRGDGGPLGHHRDDPKGNGRDRHHLKQPAELPGLDLGGAEPGPQRLLLQDDGEPLAGRVEDSLAFHAGGDGGVKVVGGVQETDPERQHGGAVGGGLEQAGDDVVLVDPERAGPLVQRYGVAPGRVSCRRGPAAGIPGRRTRRRARSRSGRGPGLRRRRRRTRRGCHGRTGPARRARSC